MAWSEVGSLADLSLQHSLQRKIDHCDERLSLCWEVVQVFARDPQNVDSRGRWLSGVDSRQLARGPPHLSEPQQNFSPLVHLSSIIMAWTT